MAKAKTPAEKQAAKARLEEIKKALPYGSIGDGCLRLRTEEGKPHWLFATIIPDESDKGRKFLDRQVLLSQDIAALGEFIHALTSRYNHFVREINEKARQCVVQPLDQIAPSELPGRPDGRPQDSREPSI